MTGYNFEDIMDTNGMIQIDYDNEEFIDLIVTGTYPVFLKEDNIIVPNHIYQELLPNIKNQNIIHTSFYKYFFECSDVDRMVSYPEFRVFYLINEYGGIYEITTYHATNGNMYSSVNYFTFDIKDFTIDIDVYCKIFDSLVKNYLNDDILEKKLLPYLTTDFFSFDYDDEEKKNVKRFHQYCSHMLNIINNQYIHEIMMKNEKILNEKVNFLTSHIETMPDGKLFFELEKHFYNSVNN